MCSEARWPTRGAGYCMHTIGICSLKCSCCTRASRDLGITDGCPLLQEVLQGKPLLVFATKQDLPGAMKPQELAQELQLASLRGRSWYVATSGAVGFQCQQLWYT